MAQESKHLSLAKQLLTRPTDIFSKVARGEALTGLLWQFFLIGVVAMFVYGWIAGTFVDDPAHWWKVGVKALLLGYGIPVLSWLALYVFLSLQGSLLTFKQISLLLLGKIATMSIVLIALLPVSWFFLFTVSQPGTAELVHMFVWLLAAFLGYIFLMRGVLAVSKHQRQQQNEKSAGSSDAGVVVLLLWGGLYVALFARMVWLLSPFFESTPGFWG